MVPVFRVGAIRDHDKIDAAFVMGSALFAQYLIHPDDFIL